MNFKTTLNEKKVLVYGMGVTGQSALRTLPEAGCSITLYVDGGLTEEDKAFVASLAHPEIITVVEDIASLSLDPFAFILRSSGISFATPLVERARREGKPVYTDLEIAYRLFGGENMIAITGSNGKTTTTSLIEWILRHAGKKAIACGNIGLPILSTMREAEEGTLFVTECSSFQLEAVQQFAPHRAAILNITEDHLEWHGSFEAYAKAKAAIAHAQKTRDTLWLLPDDTVTHDAVNQVGTEAKIIQVDLHTPLMEDLRQGRNWHLVGEHNIQNAAFAVAIAKDLDIPEDTIVEALSSFHPIEHRMEDVGTVLGVRYINDSKGTNVDATVKALSGIHQPILLIAGGYDKNVCFDAFFEAFRPHGKKLLLIGQTAQKLAKEAKEKGLGDRVVIAETLKKAMDLATTMAEEGDLVLLSPASASWGQYNHFEERGEEFRALVKAWKEKNE
ncbi:UDP-N-acetylmuramoyl-L-alanine--D-glutamate ligase [Murdochiella massiliensis]|uniref:UDP-N-acetylmuramoyl-L-alanine--D-glutamate ligase n=1 Tax=Murdochiella massiliensis TaxID=1673723 RepID=UPI000830F56A|nr:UDP-N-acetylmuramoyl-L-alanine--D-glutamate ligase [Murdochiella massiliensis]